MRIAVLDLGSNSFTALVVEIGADGSIVQVSRERQSVQLGARTAGNGTIDQEGWRRAMVTMAGLVGQARMSGARRVLAVATGALREAENGAELLQAAGRELDFETVQLSPAQAARLAYLGVRADAPAWFGRVAVVDVGGGSIDIAVGDGPEPLFTCSLPLGIQRLRLALEGASAEEVTVSVRDALAGIAKQVRDLEPEQVVFASGTARAVYKLVKKRRSVGVGDGWMDRAALHRVAGWARKASSASLAEAGVKEDRRSTIAVSATVVDVLTELFDACELWVSKRGLREGVVIDDLRSKVSVPRSSSVGERSAEL